MTAERQPPNRMPWPPMILAAALACGLVLQALVPVDMDLPPGVGWSLVAVAIGLDVWAIATLRAARTTVLPHRAAERLVRTGPFAWTRNPIYVGNTLLLTGLGLALGTAWLLLGAAVAAVSMHRLAVLPEERHLAATFGADWTEYAAVTPRWVGIRRARPPNA